MTADLNLESNTLVMDICLHDLRKFLVESIALHLNRCIVNILLSVLLYLRDI